MLRKWDNQKKNNSERGNSADSSGNTPNNHGNIQGGMQKMKRGNISNRNREQSSGRNREQVPFKERGNVLSRSGLPRQNYQPGQSGGTKSSLKYKSEETVDDIREDIARIEKEIHMEIKEIRSLKL